MWFVVTFGSPCALNIARLISRMRSFVCRAICAARGWSAAELFYQIDIFLLRVFALGALELGPGFVLGRADEIEEAGLRPRDIAFGALLVERVELEQGVVVRPLLEQLDVFACFLEL